MVDPDKRVHLVIMDENGVASEHLETIEEVEAYIRKVKGDRDESAQGWYAQGGEEDE